MEKDKIRFNNGFKVVGDCHLWQGFLDKDGYGTFYFNKKARRVHRVAYYFAYGDIPSGMVIDHICKKRNCVNFQHLRCITAKENTLENSTSVGAINRKKTHCKQGHIFDKIYGKQRYCSICSNQKSIRLKKKWREEANLIKC